MQKEWNNFWIAKQKNIFKKIKRSRKTINMIQVLFSKSYRADFIFKNMATEEQSTIDIEDLIDKIYNIIEEYGS